MIDYHLCSSDDELRGILALQHDNLKKNLSKEEIRQQGFVTVVHSFPDIKKLNAAERHVVGTVDGKVIAYLLAMTKAAANDIPALQPMFGQFEKIYIGDMPVSEQPYIIVGQVCVAKDFRGKHVLDDCYDAYRNAYGDRYRFAITEIAVENQRSLNAHRRVGFDVIHKYSDPGGIDWAIVAWDW
ncbi:MAG TPA: GNAT family N-acetyltransferase [Chitinophagaceae bacterium]|jgi:hypothetical protein